MAYWRTVKVHQNDTENESVIEELKCPYQCAMADDWEGFKQYYTLHPKELNSPMTVYGDTAFHIVASCSTTSEGKKVLEFLVNSLMSTYEEKCYALRVPNNDGNNTLHEVAVAVPGNMEAAEFLVCNFNKPAEDVTATDHNATLQLLETRNKLGETPLYRAAALGNTHLIKFFTKKLVEEHQEDSVRRHFYRDDKISILHIAVLGQHFETAVWLQQHYPFLAEQREDRGLTSLQLLAQMPLAFEPKFQSSMWKMFIYRCIPDEDLVIPNEKDDVESSLDHKYPRQSNRWKNHPVVMKVYSSPWHFLAKGTGGRQSIIYKIWDDKKNTRSREKLIPLLVEKDFSWEKTNYEVKTKTISLGSREGTKSDKQAPTFYDYTPLLAATITGVVRIVEEIIKQHPQAAEHINSNEQNILHLAIKYRKKGILELIETKPTVMSRLIETIDADGNTLLHQASDRSYYTIATSEKLPGPAMQLQSELGWVERVKNIVPSHYKMHRNNKNQTAEELFNEYHNDLLKSAQDWVKGTAGACSTVAVLVAGVVFAAAYATPGGNDDNGVPVFQDSPLFMLFTCMDVVAISCSMSSLAFFLSVFSSPLEYPDFLSSLPVRVKAGFVLLFLSIATTMLSFVAIILLLIRVEKTWTKSILYPIAFFPVPLFGLLQFHRDYSFKVIIQTIKTIFHPFKIPFLFFSKRRSRRGQAKAH